MKLLQFNLRSLILMALSGVALLTGACGASVQQIIPTSRPSLTPTLTIIASATADAATPTRTPATPQVTQGPSPTALFGPTRTPSEQQAATRAVNNPNAPRIEFFRANQDAVAPGDSVTLFWSVRGVRSAVIYRLDAQGQRNLVYNIPPDGSETVRTGVRERGRVEFVLVAGEPPNQSQQTVIVALACPITWFFAPSPSDCPNEEPEPTIITEMAFERGRMFYVESTNRVYVLFNDGRTPAWTSFENRYDPAVHPELDENFERALVGTGFKQPLGRLGFVWRGSDTVRTRLGNGIAEELRFDGFLQTAPVSGSGGGNSLYISSADSKVVQLLPNGEQWQIITPS